MTEKQFQKKIIDYLKLKGFYIMNVEGLTNGTPDLIVSGNGRFIAIELKVDKYKLQPIQATHLRLIRKSGGIAFSLRYSDNWIEELEDYIKEDKIYEIPKNEY